MLSKKRPSYDMNLGCPIQRSSTASGTVFGEGTFVTLERLDDPYPLRDVLVTNREMKMGYDNVGRTQCWDADGRSSKELFRVASYPTYLVIDHEGVILHGQQAWSPRAGLRISEEVDQGLAKARSGGGKR